jgi:hypothetical protein
VSVLERHDLRAAADLPDLVQRYVARSLPADALNRQPIRFSQVGEMQLKAGRWSPFRAEQEMNVDHVEFSWRAAFRLMPLVSVQVRDWYSAGAGGLDVRLWGLFRVVHGRGPEIARGEAIRYLVELPLAPQAMALNTELDWRVVDESTVEVTTLIDGERVVARLHFDPAGDIVAASAPARPRSVGKQAVDTPLRGVYAEYQEFSGVRVPTTAEVSWLLPDGPLTYFRCRITGWSVDKPVPVDGARR